jgi:hypothetical protein
MIALRQVMIGFAKFFLQKGYTKPEICFEIFFLFETFSENPPYYR